MKKYIVTILTHEVWDVIIVVANNVADAVAIVNEDYRPDRILSIIDSTW